MHDVFNYACCPVKSNGLSLDKEGFWSILKGGFLGDLGRINPSVFGPKPEGAGRRELNHKEY
jgi:hypothetical protein